MGESRGVEGRWREGARVGGVGSALGGVEGSRGLVGIKFGLF